MIKNQIIIDKVSEKTSGDVTMNKFLMDILQNESEGKQFRKYFSKRIKESAAQRMGEKSHEN